MSSPVIQLKVSMLNQLAVASGVIEASLMDVLGGSGIAVGLSGT